MSNFIKMSIVCKKLNTAYPISQILINRTLKFPNIKHFYIKLRMKKMHIYIVLQNSISVFKSGDNNYFNDALNFNISCFCYEMSAPS